MIVLMVLFSIFACVGGGFLWAFGGGANTDKNWRRVGVPVLVGLTGLILFGFWWWLPLACVVLYASCTVGYGIPSPDDGDSGSPLGRFWYEVTGDLGTANMMTRMTCGFLYGLCPLILSLPNITIGLIGLLVVTITTTLLGHFLDDVKPIDFWGLKVNGEEYCIGFFVLVGCVIGMLG